MSSDPTPRRATPRDERIGTLVGGKFRVLERIGAGGMGRVYRAEQQPLGRVVALKIVRVAGEVAEGSQADVLEKRFFREASILARLAHPNIVTVFDFGRIAPGGDPSRPTLVPDADEDEHDRQYYMAMELVQGETLEERLKHRGALPWRETVRLARQIARGLHEAHAVGVVHRDLKPANVMITRTRDGAEIVKLLDFGIGKIVDDAAAEEPALTMDGIFVGSPGYVAPEQVMTGLVDARSDIYSLGVVLYRCLAGQSPFPESRTAMALMSAHVHETPRSLRAVATGTPTWLAGLVHRCLEKSPDRRPQSVEDLLVELGAHPSLGAAEEPVADDASPLDEFDSPMPLMPSGPEPTTVADGSVSTTGPRTIRPAWHGAPGAPGANATDGATPPASKRVWIVAAPLLVAVAALGGFFALRATLQRSATSAPASASAASAPSSFALVVDSTPRGASVRERDRVLGVTPLTLTIDTASVVGAPRAFTVELEGYEPYAIAQGPSREAVKVVAKLQPLATAAASSAAATTASTAAAATTKPGAARPVIAPANAAKKGAATVAKPPVDIQLSR